MRSLKKPFVTFLILLLTVSMISTLAPVAQAETWTDINLPYTITESGNYRIAAAWNGSGVGLTINASNVVVDGQNNLLESKESEGDSAVGIFSSGTNVFLRRINQTSAEVGLYCIEGNVTVQDCTFANNTVRGIFAYEIADFTIENCNILYNDEGIWITYANNTSIKNSIINQNGYGISAANSVNVTIVDSSIEGNIVGVISEFGQNLFVDNSNINNNEEIALASLLGTLTFANSQTTNNTVGLYSIMSDQFTVTNATLTGNLAGILGLEGNLTLKESEICDNVLYGGLIQLSNATIKDCNINNNRLGLLSEGNEILRIEDCNVHNNSAIGFVDYWGKATEVISNSFKNNGLNNGVSTRGALVAQDNNCTVTSNVFESNYDALLFGIFEYEQNNTQIYNKNIFTNNDFTFEFNYELPSEYKNQQIYFYNNLVNDTAYVNPDSFNQEYRLIPPEGVFHINGTVQVGERPYSEGRLVGGNFWTHPNGTGFSVTGVDQDRDGFIDTSFTFFGNDSTAIGTDYHPYSLEFDVNMWVPVTLPATITQFGNYKITSPWTGSGIALEITADNVVVDGQNSLLSLTGSEDYPTVVIYDSSNVLLKNMNITQGAASIYVAESSHVTIRGTNLYENSIIGLYAFGCQNLTVQNCRIEWCQDFAGIYAVECTGIYIVKSILNHNAGDGITLDSVTHFTVANCTLNYNGWGMEAWQSNNGVVQNCLMSNNTQAVYSQELNNVTFCDNVFSYNGLSDGVYCGGFESAYGNCTVTGNLFEGNYDALMWRTRNNNDTSTMNVHSNVFLNNKYTFFFYSRQTSDSTSHKLLFYNNMVNDTAYVDPECFNSTYSWDYLPLSGVNLNLNTTLQSGARIYGSPSKVGGNFWAKPDGTGYSQTGTDSNRDGFIDAPFDLFNNATIGVVYDYLPYSQNYATSLAFTAGGAQTLAANQTSTLVTVRLQDAYGAITTGATVSLTSNFTTAKFYSDAAGTNQITSVTIPAGSSTASFYFKDTAAGNPTLVASSPSVIAASTQFTVNQHAATVQYITISPAAATVAAGTAVTYYTTAYDPYGNSWNVTSTYNVNGNDLSANTLTPIQAGTYLVEATYNDLAASTTLTATPAALDHFAVLVPSSVFVGTPFDIVVYALDAYRNVVTGYAGTASLSINKGAITPATPGDFIEGVWTGKVAVSETGQVAISASDSNGHKGQSVNFTVTSQPTPTPTPNPTSTIEVTTPNGGNINLAINGNITSSQISGATLTTNQTSSATTLSFTLTGQTGTTGFCNITIPKSQVLYGTTPTVYVDGQPAQNQGFSQDNQNYYVWYTTSFSTHQMQVVFSGQSTNGLDASLVWYALIIAVGIAVVALSFLVIRQKQKHAT